MMSFSPITHGRPLNSLRTGGFSVTEAAYPAGYMIPRHGHASASLTFVLSGSVREELHGRTESLSPRELLLKPPALSHSNRFGDRGARLLLVEVFEPADSAEAAVQLVFARASRLNSARLTTPLMRVSNELHHRDAYSALSVEGLLLELVAELARANAAAHCTPAPAYVRRTRDRMHAGLAACTRLSELAAAEGVEARRLARDFRRSYGCSIAAYARKLRLEVAMTALLCTETPIAAVAAMAGFADQSHLTRELRRATGLTPRAYREQAKIG